MKQILNLYESPLSPYEYPLLNPYETTIKSYEITVQSLLTSNEITIKSP